MRVSDHRGSYRKLISTTDIETGGALADGAVGGLVAVKVRQRLERRRNEMVALLGEMVVVGSSGDDPDGLIEMADYLEQLFGSFGKVARYPVGPGGSGHLVVRVPSADEGLAHAAVLGHFDTVWPRGTLQRLPFAVDGDGLARGPGCIDMKGGLVLLWFALAELAATGRGPGRPLRILLNCDEEGGAERRAN